MNSRTRTLLLSIHDVGPRFESEIDRLREQLLRHAPADRIALLVVPDHWGEAPLTPGTPFATKLRGWAEQGAEIFVHGWYHQDKQEHGNGWTGFKARHFTAREGEFLGLPRSEANARMHAGRALIEDVTGVSASGFVAPAWLYGSGAIEALGDTGFGLAEDHWKVWNPRDGRILARGPVLTWASRSRWRTQSSLAVARCLPTLMRRMEHARIAVHPGDVHVKQIRQSIDRAVTRMLHTHRPGRYDALAPCLQV